MKKPNGYDTAPAYMGGEAAPQLEPGGYVCKIKQAKEETTESGYWMLALAFDIAEGPHAGFYEAQYKERIKNDAAAKWPGVYRQGIQGRDGQCSPFFKGMITAIENSNPGYTFNFDEATLIGKVFGGVFGQEEWKDRNGAVRTSTKLQSFRSASSIREGDYKVPEIKRLDTPQQGRAKVSFAPVAAIGDEECPF